MSEKEHRKCRECGVYPEVNGQKFWLPGALFFAKYPCEHPLGVRPICDNCKTYNEYLKSREGKIWV